VRCLNKPDQTKPNPKILLRMSAVFYECLGPDPPGREKATLARLGPKATSLLARLRIATSTSSSVTSQSSTYDWNPPSNSGLNSFTYRAYILAVFAASSLRLHQSRVNNGLAPSFHIHTRSPTISANMDQRELDLRLKALQKAVAEKEPASNVISILETLKKEVVPTEELLRVSSLTWLHIPKKCSWTSM
jgi:hypothetical protein